MIRRAFVMRLKPDSLAEYRRHHEKIWPELMAEIERSGIASITTFRREHELFVVSEIADDASWERLWSSDVHNRWAQLLRPLMRLGDSGAVESIELEEIVHIAAGTVRQPTVETIEGTVAANEPAGTSPAAMLEDDFEPAFEMVDEPTMVSAVESRNGARVESPTVSTKPPVAPHVASPVPPAKRAHKMAARRTGGSARSTVKDPAGASNASSTKKRKRSAAKKSAKSKPVRRKKTRPAKIPASAKKKSTARKHR